MKQFLKLEFTLEFFKLIFLINLNLFGFQNKFEIFFNIYLIKDMIFYFILF